LKRYKDYVLNEYIISMSSDSSATTSAAERFTGRVKWFNNKAGYGFITVTDGARSGSDIFVHHSGLGVSSDQYKYLVQGEYVDFDMVSVQGGAHETQASNVSGIKGGKLMCETRHEFKVARVNHNEVHDAAPPSRTRSPLKRSRADRQQNTSRPVSTRPSAARQDDKKEWTLAKKPRAPRRRTDN
jgi:CspA family cold shock protein